MSVSTSPATVQAWIQPSAVDPDALSAQAVAGRRLDAGRDLIALERFRMIEIAGPLPDPGTIRALLHRSIQFYNPHQERLTLRARAEDPSPASEGVLVLVVERDGERRLAAERWWRHQTGETVEVREAEVWQMRLAAGPDARERAGALVALHDRRHGLLCNPNAQWADLAEGRPPLPWITRGPRGDAARFPGRDRHGRATERRHQA